MCRTSQVGILLDFLACEKGLHHAKRMLGLQVKAKLGLRAKRAYR